MGSNYGYLMVILATNTSFKSTASH